MASPHSAAPPRAATSRRRIPLALCVAWACLHPCLAQQTQPVQTALLNPRALAIDSNTHKLFVVDQPRNQVIMEDIASRTTKSVPVGKTPDALSIDPARGRVYVVNSASNTVSVLDEATASVLAEVPTGRMPYAIQVDPGLHKTLVMNTYSDSVTEIGTENAARSLPLGSKDAVAIDTRLHQAWLLGYQDPQLTRLDLVHATTARVPAATHLWALAIDEDRSLLYATEAQDSAVLVLDERTGEHTTLPVGAMPCAAAIDPATGLVYVANYAGNTVSILNSKAVLATIPVLPLPQAITVDPRRHLAYVAHTHSDSVTVIDTYSRKVLTTLAAGHSPYAIALDPDTGAVYVANLGAAAYTRLANEPLLAARTP